MESNTKNDEQDQSNENEQPEAQAEERSETSSDSSGNRWDPDVLNELECKNVFVDDADEHLPEFLDLERIQKVKSDEC